MVEANVPAVGIKAVELNCTILVIYAVCLHLSSDCSMAMHCQHQVGDHYQDHFLWQTWRRITLCDMSRAYN